MATASPRDSDKHVARQDPMRTHTTTSKHYL